MTKISRSPERYTFQKESYLARMEETGKTPDPEEIFYFDSWIDNETDRINDPEWQKNNMEYDLRTTDWILEKVRNSDPYAQNLYAAMCNNDFIKNDVVPILKEEKWSCSWRHAGGVIADMRQRGDYMDWYCSGSFDKDYPGYVPECEVTDEIRADLLKLGWIVKEHKYE